MDENVPDRPEFVVRHATVLTCDPNLGDLPDGDVHVRDGQIIAVGPDLPVPDGVDTLDGRGTIVTPGLVDTHWHMWNTLYRSLAGSAPDLGYFAANLRYGPALRPEDTYHGVRLALADALSSGITTVHDWSHNMISPAHADQNLRAHAETGLRARFSYGPHQGHATDRTIDLADLERLHREWFNGSNAGAGGLLHLGLAGRPPGLVEPAVYREEWAAARRLGIPVSYHCASTRALQKLDTIRTMHGEGMLGPDTQLIHVLYTDAAERALVADSGASVTISPWTEMMIGYGVPPVRDLVDAGVLVTLSVDTVALSGTADMFSIMRVVINLAHGQAEAEFGLSAADVLRMATLDGARGLGLADVTGSLTPGKRADLIMIRTDAPNIAPFTDPALMVVLAAGPANVDTVVVDGRILKRHGRLTALDSDAVVAEASASLSALLARTP